MGTNNKSAAAISPAGHRRRGRLVATTEQIEATLVQRLAARWNLLPPNGNDDAEYHRLNALWRRETEVAL